MIAAATELMRLLIERSATERTPNSAPWERANSGEAVAGSPVNGSVCNTMPSAEFE